MGALIPLYRRGGSVIGYARVSPVDAELASAFRWSLSKSGYAIRMERGRQVSLHRLLLGLGHGDPREGDHKNLDRQDCRRENLRIVTHAQNMQNKPSQGGTSRFRGVYREVGRNKWRAQVRANGRKYTLGNFDTEEQAAEAARAARARLLPFSVEVAA